MKDSFWGKLLEVNGDYLEHSIFFTEYMKDIKNSDSFDSRKIYVDLVERCQNILKNNTQNEIEYVYIIILLPEKVEQLLNV